MHGRIKHYARIVAWQSGLGYIALWAMTLWTLGQGGQIFAQSGVCHRDMASVLFYWSCAPDSPLSFVAALVNTALTMTVWAPVYAAAAWVRPDALIFAGPILATHIVGLPAALYVMIRSMTMMFSFLRRLAGRLRESGSGPIRRT
jgi:hypothetical protein